MAANFRLTNCKIIDKNGKVISAEEYKQLEEKRLKKIADKYGLVADNVASVIKLACQTQEQMLKVLFAYLTQDSMKYEMGYIINQYSTLVTYPFDETTQILSSKESVLLNHAGMCSSYSDAFKDICDKLGIPCVVVIGNTGLKHAWNAVLVDGTVKHIDIAYAICNRNHRDVNDYFLKNTDEINRLWGHRTIDKTPEEIKRMIINEQEALESHQEELNSSRPGFRVLDENHDQENSHPGFRVLDENHAQENSHPGFRVLDENHAQENSHPGFRVLGENNAQENSHPGFRVLDENHDQENSHPGFRVLNGNPSQNIKQKILRIDGSNI